MLETYNGVSVSLPSFQYGSRTATHHNPDPYCLANFSVIDNTRSLARRSLVILNLLYCPRSNTVDHYVTELVLQVKDQTSYYISAHISLIVKTNGRFFPHLYTKEKMEQTLWENCPNVQQQARLQPRVLYMQVSTTKMMVTETRLRRGLATPPPHVAFPAFKVIRGN